MSKTVWIGIVVAIVVIGGIWWWVSQSSSMQGMNMNDQGTATTQQQASSTTSTGGIAPMSATIMYDGNSFSPSSVTIAEGGTVTFVDSSGTMWVASDPHPVHDGYDGTTQQVHCAAGYSGPAPFDQCSAGSQFSFTFGKVGSWGFHDHLNESAGGTVNVVAQ